MPEREGDGGQERAVSQAGCATSLSYFSLAGQWEKLLNVLSNEMDLAESRFIRQVVVKELDVEEKAEKSVSPPSCESPPTAVG